MLFCARLKGSLEQTHMAHAGITAKRFQRCIADAALGGGDGTDKGGIVIAIGEQAQITDQILDLGTIKE